MQFRCKICKKEFGKKNILRRHLREKHYCGRILQCNLCNTSFARKERLIRHLKSIHKDLKFKCNECHEKFIERCSYNSHMTKKHQYSYCGVCKTPYTNVKPHFCTK